MLHVRDLPVAEIALLLIFSESDYMYFICCLSGCGVGACNLIKIYDYNHTGLVVLFAVSCPAFSDLVWGG